MKQHQKKEDPNYQSLELKSGTSKDDHTASHQFSQASLNDTEMLEIKSFRSTENKVIELTQNESITEHNQIKSELIIPQEEEEQSEDTKWQKFNFYMNTNIFGRIFLYDVFKLLLRAAKDSKLYKKLTLEDLPFLFPNHRTAHTHEKLQKYLDEAVDKAIKSGREIVGMDFVWMFLKLFKFEMILIILLQIFLNSSKMYSTIHMKRLIQSIEEKGVTSDAYMDALYLNATMIIYVLIYHNTPRINCMIFSIFRNAFMKALYQKVASLSSHAVKQANVGKLINLVANDLANVEYRFNIMVQVITTPYPLVIMCYLVYQNYGMLGIAGLSIMFLAGPLQMLISHLSTPYYAEKSKVVDDRVKLTNEIVEGIRLIKMYAWEKAFQKVILIIKKSEMRKNMMVQMLTLLNHSIELASSLFGAFITFTLVYYYRDGANLNLGTIFSTVDQFNYIKNEVISSLGWGIQGFFQLKVVLNRMVSVINLKNTSMTCIQGSNEYERSERLDVGTIQFKDFSAYWSANTPVLKDINLTLKKGEIVSVIGKVGAGKTSLLNCILKEIPMFKGSFNYRGKLAYVEQEPYIFNYSIRDNITFGKLYDEELYQNVIKACCLDVDLKLFQEGDSTQIGERGINISGGQKARISLARALYSEADIYLFDDPLSAVDAKVAKSLFFNVIKVVGKNSTVLFTTHQIHFSRYSDRVLIFEDGRIKEQGTYNELANEIKKLSLQLSHATEGEEGTDNSETHHDEFFEETQTEEEEKSQEKESVKEELEKVKVQPQNEKRKSISKNEEEIALKSKVNLDTYKFFYKSSDAPFVFFVILLMFVVSEVLFVVFSKTLGKISGDEIESNLMKLGWIVLFYFILQLVKNFFIVLYFNNAGYNIHQKMVHSLLRATVQFFDITPSGTILNLFSTDIGIIDTGLVNQVADVLEIMIQIFIFLGSIMIMTPYFIIVGILQFAVLTYFVRQTKIALFHTKQLDLNSRGPVFTFFNVVVQGVLPIRVYQQSQFFEKQYNILGDNSLRATWYFCLSSRGFGFFIHFMATVFNAIGIFLIIYVIKDSSLIGQSIILFMSSIELLQWGVRQIIQADVAMSSTQRCKNLVEELSEAELISQYDRTTLKISETSSNTYLQNNDLIQKFPSRGELVFQNVKMRYRKDLDLVLKDLTFKIEPGQRIGFVGRTGAGKSSLIQALFRMTEIENSQYFHNEGQQNQTGEDTEGNYIDVEGIYIDGHNIQKLGLHTLRSGISIIPQVPFVFSGTIRRNLDPLDEYTDDQILQVLEDIELLDKVNSLENKMDTDMTNTSQVFSAGQKQLICLGRAILRQSKLIVLDEATANCDMLTDELIQRKVRERFLNSTIITIAHRLNTIADYDQIIVVDKGQAVEQGSPYELLQNQQGFFFQMVANTGTKNASVINKIASEKYQQSKSEER